MARQKKTETPDQAPTAGKRTRGPRKTALDLLEREAGLVDNAIVSCEHAAARLAELRERRAALETALVALRAG